jgi:hypothetical protein
LCLQLLLLLRLLRLMLAAAVLAEQGRPRAQGCLVLLCVLLPWGSALVPSHHQVLPGSSSCSDWSQRRELTQ